MASINQVTLLGRVGQAPKVSTSQNGVVSARLTVATSRKVNNTEEVQWHNVVCFGKAAEFAKEWIHKGDLVVVLGEIKYSKYTNQKGEDMFVTSIMAGNIQLASKKLEGNTKQDDNDLPSDF